CGIATWTILNRFDHPLDGLRDLTLRQVFLMLRLLGQHPELEAQARILTVGNFKVYVAPSCSGAQGIALVCIFLGAYLWLCRKDLRFPHALLLLPVGIALTWILNLVRVTALIMIGVNHREFAIGAFHSVAGWALFNFVAVALVAA